MSILEVRNLNFSYGDEALYNNLNLKVETGEHIGFLGANGTGKSTLLKLLAHKLIPDSGEIIWQDHVTYSYLDQFLEVDSEVSVLEYLNEVYRDLFLKEEKLNKIYHDISLNLELEKNLRQADLIQEELLQKGFYKINEKIDNILLGLGVAIPLDFPLKNLSGGMRAKVFLAKMLLEEKDVLLLDEPTNFLDQVHIEWLVKFLNSYPKAYIVISHNFQFLNEVSNYIIELENRVMTKYKGNFLDYLNLKTMRSKEYEKAYLKQQEKIKKEEEFIKKNIVRATTTKRAQSRRKQLEKMERLEKPVVYKDLNFKFKFTRSFNMNALEVKNLSIGYDHPILKGISMKLAFGDRIAILGKNGVGKTTFLKTILDFIPKISGSYDVNPLNKISYFAQVEEPQDINAIDYIRLDYPLMDNGEIRSLLAKFGITGELVTRSMQELSGGEGARVRLAKLTLEESNFLILDEPTNHLDKTMKQALFDALASYPGTLIIVSHELEFINKLKLTQIKFT